MSDAWFEKNLKVLKKVNPDLAEKVSICDDGFYSTHPTARKGFPNLLYNGTKPALIFYDHHDPINDIRLLLKDIMSERNRFHVLFGMGLGYLASEIIKRYKNLFRMIIIERDIACLKKAMQTRSLTDIINHPAVKIIAGCEEEDLYISIYKAVDPLFRGLKEIKFIPWPASIQVAQPYYDQVMRTFQHIVNTYVADRGNDPYDTLVAYEQFFSNIEELMKNPGAAHVKNLFKGRPAVVVATGPSLKKNIHHLKKLENTAVIISVDASLRILHNNNIFPHLVTTIERPPGFAAYYRGLQNLDKTVFAAVSFVHPSTLNAYDGPRLFFHRLYNFMLKLGFEEDAMKLGMSTANMAYEVARHMGCNPIILVGNDLSYDSTGKTHAPGFILGEKQPLYNDFDKFAVPGNYEKWVTTCDGWLACIKEYEKRLEGWDGTLINATEGGARIRGTIVMTLKEAIVKYAMTPFHPRETLIKHLSVWENPRCAASMMDTIDKYIDVNNTFIGVCIKMRDMLHQTLKDIENAGETLPPSLINHIEDSLPHVETVLNSILESDLLKYFNEYFYSDLFPLLMEWQVVQERFADQGWANAYRIKLAENYFASMGQLCTSLKEVLNDGKKRLSAFKS